MYRPWSEEQTNEQFGSTWGASLEQLQLLHWQFFHHGKMSLAQQRGNGKIPGMYGPFCDLASLTQLLKSSGAYMISIYLNSWDTHSRFTVVQISPKPEKDTQRRSWTCCAMTPDIRSGRIAQNQGRYGGAQAYLQSWLCDPDTSCASTDVI